MMQASELFTLARDLAHLKVLSVHIHNRVVDPAMRYAWRADLASRLRNTRKKIADAAERAQFDRAAASLEKSLPQPGGMWAAPGWTAFATDNRLVVIGDLPGRVETLVAWQEGAVITPCLRALKHETPVIVALVHSRAARLYRYVHGAVESLGTMQVSAFERRLRRSRGARTERGGRGYPAPRSALRTEIAHDRQLTEFHRLATALAGCLTLLAGPDGCILLGGPPQHSRCVFDALPRELQRRAVVSSELEQTASTDVIVRAAKRAAREWRSRRGRQLVSRMFVHSGHRTVAGVPALQRALYLKAVDLLLMSPRFLHSERGHAERLLHAALAQGADVEVLSGDAGMLLDGVADGVGARLRFSIDAPARTSASFDRAATPIAPRAS
jgi:peptide subunit release factor 1 (eRF1)